MPSGQPYLSNPDTNEVRWLYSRYHDGKASADFLVNAVTGERIWATAENAYLCPPFVGKPQSSNTQSVNVTRPQRVARAAAIDDPTIKRTGYSASTSAKPISIKPPPYLSLSNDEVFLQASGSRPYIYNKRTKASRWPPGDVAISETATTSTVAPAQSSAGRTAAARVRALPSSTEAAMSLQRALRARAVRRDGVVEKLRKLSDVTSDVHGIIASGAKHDMIMLRASVASVEKGGTGGGDRLSGKDANQRLLELGEYVTQRMLIADGVSSAGSDLVRARRKSTIKAIIALTDEIDTLRKRTRACAKSPSS
jgi:BAG domain